MSQRFARACPFHHLVLEEQSDGRLRCPRSPHRVIAWIVVDTESGDVLGAGRDRAGLRGRPPEIHASAEDITVPVTEDSLALEFTRTHRDELRYIHEWWKWLKWDGAR